MVLLSDFGGLGASVSPLVITDDRFGVLKT